LSEDTAGDVWTYKSIGAWRATLCHCWLFWDGVPVGLMEQVAVGLLKNLYENSRAESNVLGPLNINQINCWKNSLLISVGRCDTNIEIFVAITDQFSRHSVHGVDSNAVDSNRRRLVVSSKGPDGIYCQNIWNMGYKIVLDSIKGTVGSFSNVERQIVCPECLANEEARSADKLSWDRVSEAKTHTIRCIRGHILDTQTICGIAPATNRSNHGGRRNNEGKKKVNYLFSSVVIVGLWDNERQIITDVGSGFIASKSSGLIVTASHILYNMKTGPGYGARYKGLKNARAIIGVIPCDKGEKPAVFRYFAKIVADDVHNMDACILKITSRLENDVSDHSLIGQQPEIFLESMKEESISKLKTATWCEVEQSARILGFNQSGEGRLDMHRDVDRQPDFVEGYVCKKYKAQTDHSSSCDNTPSSEEGNFSPKVEIVVICKTKGGHSGGPCVNDQGQVVGILSRVDPVDPERNYLVPSSAIKALIRKANRTS